MGIKYTSLITARGCPYNCIFCFPIFKNLRKRSVENVIKEIISIILKDNIRLFLIFDDTFNIPPRWVIKFCDKIIRLKLKISFMIRCRPDLIINQEMTNKLKEAGCYMITLGIESANNKTLKFLNKGYNIEQIKNAIKLIKNAKIKIHGSFILGTPIETKREMLNTINFSLKSKIDFASFSFLTPLPGTKLYEMAERRGWWKDNDKLDYSDLFGGNTPSLKHPELSEQELLKIYRKAYLSFLIRFRTIFNIIYLLINNPFYPLKLFRYQIK